MGYGVMNMEYEKFKLNSMNNITTGRKYRLWKTMRVEKKYLLSVDEMNRDFLFGVVTITNKT